MLEKDTALRDKLEWNTNYFKAGMKKAGFDIIEGDSAIVPVMLYDAKLAQTMANELLKKGIYIIGFFFTYGSRRQSENKGSIFNDPFKRTIRQSNNNFC